VVNISEVVIVYRKVVNDYQHLQMTSVRTAGN